MLRGRRLAAGGRVAAIYATGPPFSVVLAGALLSRVSGVPLIADFRDTWTLDASDPFGTIGGTYRSRAIASRRRVLERIEAWCLGRSDVVLFTSESTKAAYESAHPSLPPKSRLIFNGADPADFEAAVEPFERPTVSHVGTVHEYQAEQVLKMLEGFARLVRESPGPRLAFVGPIVSGVRSVIEVAVARLGLQDTVEFIGPLPRRAAVTWLRRSTALVLYAGRNPYIRLSKISEYVASRRPFLAMAAPGSETARDVAEHGAVIPSSEEPLAIANALREVVSDGLSRSFAAAAFPFAHPHALNRRSEAAQLASLLEEAAQARALR